MPAHKHPLRLYVRQTLEVGQEADFLKGVGSLVELVKKQPGTLQYEWFYNGATGRVVTLESHVDAAGLVAHLTNAEKAPLLQQLAPLGTTDVICAFGPLPRKMVTGLKKAGLPLRLLHAMGDVAIFQPLRDKLGLVNVKSAYSSGAALNPDVIRFFRAIGVNIKQLYGSTEAQVHTLHVGDDVRFETVGLPPPGMEIRIADDGEVLVKGPTVVRGYYKNPQATEEAFVIDEQGGRWYRTGDAGYIDSAGHLIYIDRVKEMLTLSSGEKYSPQYIEGRLKFSPYIRNAMTVGGEDNPFVTALINVDFDNVGRWAERRGLAYTTFVDLSQKPQVYELIREDVERVNSVLPPAARVHKFVLLHKEFDADEGELTRTRKLRRGLLGERYGDMITAMYGGEDRVQVQAAVRYRDGREGTIKTTVRIATLADNRDETMEENPA